MIEIEQLRKQYDGRNVVAGLDLRVAPGEIYALLGEPTEFGKIVR